MKKFLKITGKVLAAFASLIVVAVIIVGYVWSKEIKTVASVRQVENNQYLYSMEYKADYNLDEVISKDLSSNTDLLHYVVSKITKGVRLFSVDDPKTNGGSFACTSFQAKNRESDGYFYGRNYDFFKNPTLVVISRPKNGYASISTCDMSHFGYSLEKLPKSFKEKLFCIASIYAPMDGINEKGLCTSIMALPKQAANQDTGKNKVGTSTIMRLFLDRCATVSEAIDMVNSLDIVHDQQVGTGYHYMVSDAQGHCAVIEFDKEDGWKTMLVEKPDGMNYMIVTNHLLSPKYYTETPDPAVGNPHSRSWWRYATVRSFMEGRNGILSFEDAQECLSLVHWQDLRWDNGIVEDTQFSNVYDQSAITLSLRNWNEYEKTVTFSLKD